MIAATNAGPREEDGDGWSRQARDKLVDILAPAGAPDYCAARDNG